jgi:hypothetical protein
MSAPVSRRLEIPGSDGETEIVDSDATESDPDDDDHDARPAKRLRTVEVDASKPKTEIPTSMVGYGELRVSSEM